MITHSLLCISREILTLWKLTSLKSKIKTDKEGKIKPVIILPRKIDEETNI